MNCQTCRKNLHLFLDDELNVQENAAVLEHLNACAACQGIFSAEARTWTAVRERLAAERCPADIRQRLLSALRRHSWRERVARLWFPVAVAAAAVLLVAAFVSDRLTRTDGRRRGPNPVIAEGGVTPTPQPGRAHQERTHDHEVHGQLVAWAGARYDELVHGLADDVTLSPVVLREREIPDRHVVDLDEFQRQLKDALGSFFRLPQGLLDGGRFVGGEVLKWNETWIPQALVEYGDREIAFYAIPAALAEKHIPRLKTIQQDKLHSIRIDQCSTCDVVLVMREKTVYLLVSRQNRDWNDDWMMQRARRILD